MKITFSQLQSLIENKFNITLNFTEKPRTFGEIKNAVAAQLCLFENSELLQCSPSEILNELQILSPVPISLDMPICQAFPKRKQRMQFWNTVKKMSGTDHFTDFNDPNRRMFWLLFIPCSILYFFILRWFMSIDTLPAGLPLKLIVYYFYIPLLWSFCLSLLLIFPLVAWCCRQIFPDVRAYYHTIGSAVELIQIHRKIEAERPLLMLGRDLAEIIYQCDNDIQTLRMDTPLDTICEM